MKLVHLIFALLLTAAGSTAGASASKAEPVHVVKFINLSCSVCRDSEIIDAPIKAAVEQQGGRFVVAPLPRGRNESRERFYYAMRELGPEMEVEVRQSLYRGAQDLNYPLNDVPQTLDWLQGDLKATTIDWPAMLAQVNGADTAAAVERAVVLAISAGVQYVPAYALVHKNKVVATFDAKSTGGQLPALREAVLKALRTQHSAP
jgi:protein-disulfide isomerase